VSCTPNRVTSLILLSALRQLRTLEIKGLDAVVNLASFPGNYFGSRIVILESLYLMLCHPVLPAERDDVYRLDLQRVTKSLDLTDVIVKWLKFSLDSHFFFLFVALFFPSFCFYV